VSTQSRSSQVVSCHSAISLKKGLKLGLKLGLNIGIIEENLRFNQTNYSEMDENNSEMDENYSKMDENNFQNNEY
jgi:hypothetical protein